MMFNNPDITLSVLLAAFATGMALGVFYFVGLWKTVKNMPSSHHPVRLMIGSFAVRILILLPVLYFITAGHWERLMAAMAGFFIIKMFLTRRLGVKQTV